MNVEEKFVAVARLISEPTRARMLWNLLDGRAYTATELATAASISSTSASNHLAKLLDANLLKVEAQGRHRYYSFSTSEVAYAVEALANLSERHLVEPEKEAKTQQNKGVTYCRTCYDHLAGYVGVQIREAMMNKNFLREEQSEYIITKAGWKWAAQLEIYPDEFANKRRPVTRKCLDWSERKAHVAGQFGARLLAKMLEEKWLIKVQFSRELVITAKGQQQLNELLGLKV